MIAICLVSAYPSGASWTVKSKIVDKWVHSKNSNESGERSSNKSANIIKTKLKLTIMVKPGTDIQSLVDINPAGTTFFLESGVHRLQQIRPKNGNTFLGEKGAILSGSKVLTDFVKEGPYWVAYGQFQEGREKGWCDETLTDIPSGGCRFPEDVFIDDIPLIQVRKFPNIHSGRWIFDYDANKIYLSDDPTGRKVETSVTEYAFVGNSKNVTIRGLTIEKYANPAQEGAIHAKQGETGSLSEGWKILDNVIRFNHGYGIRIATGMKILRNNIHHNGQLGLGGTGEDILIEHNEIAHNNTQGFNWLIEGGGAKVVGAQNVVFRRNYAHHNIGPGLWADSDNINITYEGNRTLRNDGPGIFHERSYNAIIKNNWCGANGFGFPVWMVGGGIVVASSTNVEISGNTVWYNADGIGIVHASENGGRFGPYEVENIYVHDNDITMGDGQTGLALKSEDISFFSNRNIRFENNNYVLVGEKEKFFRWMNNLRTESEWKNFGQDLGGSVTRIRNWKPDWIPEGL